MQSERRIVHAVEGPLVFQLQLAAGVGLVAGSWSAAGWALCGLAIFNFMVLMKNGNG